MIITLLLLQVTNSIEMVLHCHVMVLFYPHIEGAYLYFFVTSDWLHGLLKQSLLFPRVMKTFLDVFKSAVVRPPTTHHENYQN